MRNIVKNPGRIKHVASTIEYLKHCGADAIVVTQNGLIYIDCTLDGHPLQITLPVSPRNVGNVIAHGKQQVRRGCRKVGVEMRA